MLIPHSRASCPDFIYFEATYASIDPGTRSGVKDYFSGLVDGRMPWRSYNPQVQLGSPAWATNHLSSGLASYWCAGVGMPSLVAGLHLPGTVYLSAMVEYHGWVRQDSSDLSRVVFFLPLRSDSTSQPRLSGIAPYRF